MGEAIKRRDYLTLLSNSKSKKRRDKLIDIADAKEMNAIAECVLNILKGNITIPKDKMRSIRQYKNDMRVLSRKSCSNKLKKNLLKQRGGILPLILPIALGALAKAMF